MDGFSFFAPLPTPCSFPPCAGCEGGEISLLETEKNECGSTLNCTLRNGCGSMLTRNGGCGACHQRSSNSFMHGCTLANVFEPQALFSLSSTVHTNSYLTAFLNSCNSHLECGLPASVTNSIDEARNSRGQRGGRDPGITKSLSTSTRSRIGYLTAGNKLGQWA